MGTGALRALRPFVRDDTWRKMLVLIMRHHTRHPGLLRRTCGEREPVLARRSPPKLELQEESLGPDPGMGRAEGACDLPTSGVNNPLQPLHHDLPQAGNHKHTQRSRSRRRLSDSLCSFSAFFSTYDSPNMGIPQVLTLEDTQLTTKVSLFVRPLAL